MVRLRIFASVASFLGVAVAPACGGGFTAAPSDGGALDGAPLDSPADSEAAIPDGSEAGPSCAPLYPVPNPETCAQNAACNRTVIVPG